ncbi:hypothetical protein ACIBEJ_48155 [Nonomuraea sp. NPDC050790]|uniref:hypothetical protein n=1 Tax=Nonomuraea sp. NPDC050790 TaxID=3364371 RepID=UPI003793C7E6
MPDARSFIRKTFRSSVWQAVGAVCALVAIPIAIISCQAASSPAPLTRIGDGDCAPVGNGNIINCPQVQLPPTPTAPREDGAAIATSAIVELGEFGQVAFAEPMVLSPAELRSLNNQGLESWLTTRPGYWGAGASNVKLTVQGRRQANITGMRARIVKRQPPIAGTLFRPGSGGNQDNIQLHMYLDDASAEARAVRDNSDYAYFDEKTVTLAPGEQEIFTIDASVSQSPSAIEWVIDITVIEPGRKPTVHTVDDHGTPFRTTAIAQPEVQYGHCYWTLNPDMQPPCTGRSATYWERLDLKVD